MLKETTAKQEGDGSLPIDTDKLLHKRMSGEDLLHFVLDVVTLGSVDDMALVVSFNHLQRRVKERNMIIADFQESGGRYLRKFGQIKD